MNKLARSITKFTKACDKSLNRLISHIHHTCEYKQYCYVGNTAKQCRLGLFQDSDFAGDLDDSKSTSGGTLCISGSHTFVPISWMCKKQTSVSHSSTESEIISLDAGLRLDGIPALDLWDLIVLVFGYTIQTHDRTERPVVCPHTNHGRKRSRRVINNLGNFDLVPSNVQFSHQEVLLCVIEDNEAVIKMIFKGRSPTMMNLIARAPSTLSSSASESPGKRSYESQSPLSAQAKMYDGTKKPVVCRDRSHEQGHYHRFVACTHSARYSGWDDDKAWSSQEWKADESMDDRTGQPVVCPQRGAHEFQSSFSHEKTKHVILEEEENHDRTGKPVVCPQREARQFVIGDDEAELELSVESRSFLDRVNDQVRKRQKTIFDECYRKRRKTFCDMENVYVCNIGISIIHGKELLRQPAFHQEYKRSHNETNVRRICKIGVQTR